MSLETVRLGNSELEITRVGIGSAPIGSQPDWRIYWGPQDENEAIRAIHAAIELEVNWIDTAPFYGWGRAEQIVGRALQGKRDRVFLFTKCGTLKDSVGGWTENLSPKSIRREIEISLRNLQTDYIDLYQFHDPDPRTPIEESWVTMQALIREGKVRYGGVSNHPVDLLQRALTVGPVISNQQQYSLLVREIEKDILPFCAQNGIGVLAWSPLASGFLTGGFDLNALDLNDFRRRLSFAQEPTWSKLVTLRTVLSSIAASHHKQMVDVALNWVLRNGAATGAIVGIRNEKEAREMMGALDWRLTPDEMKTIETALAAYAN